MNDKKLSNSESALNYVWEQYRTCAALSRKLKKSVRNKRVIVSILTIAGAILGTLSLQLSGIEPMWIYRTCAGLSGLSIASAGIISRELLSSKHEKKWVQARSAAESFKSECYLFATQTPPYDDEKAATKLLEKVKAYMDRVKHLEIDQYLGVRQPERTIPYPLTIAEYTENRVIDQVNNYYLPKSKVHRRIANINSYVRLILSLIAAALGFLASVGLSINPAGWVAVFSTVTMAIAAHVYAGRHSYLVLSYQSTAQHLKWLLAKWNSSSQAQNDKHEFVRNCESTISIENSSWMAEWVKEG